MWRIGRGRYQGQNVPLSMTAGICGASFLIRQWWVIGVRKWVFLVKWWVKESPL